MNLYAYRLPNRTVQLAVASLREFRTARRGRTLRQIAAGWSPRAD